MRRFGIDALGLPRLSKTAGHHRFRWDFAMAGPWDPSPSRAGRGGPWVAPGTYQVRLTVDDWSATQPVRVLPDPRLTKEGLTTLDYQAQLTTALAARDLVSAVRALVVNLAERRKTEANPRLAELEATLTAGPGRYPTPRLAEQAEYLYRMTLSADQRLGRDVTERLAELREQLAKAEAVFKAATP